MNETTRKSETEKAERTYRMISLGLVVLASGWLAFTSVTLLVAPSPLAVLAQAVAAVSFAVTVALS
jgi:hypothetical protein